MLSDLGFSLREAVRALGRALSMHVFSGVSIALSLLLLGLSIVGWSNLQHMLGMMRGQSTMTAYLRENATPAGVRTAEGAIAGEPGVRRVRFVSAAQALAQMRRTLGPNGKLIDELGGVNPFTGYLAIEVAPADAAAVAQFAQGQAAVLQVQDDGAVLQRLAALGRAADLAEVGVLGIATVVALVVVSHVVRLSIYARREEIETLELMGASRAFVSLPFFFEGMIVGGGGGLFAGALLGALLPLLTSAATRAVPFVPLLPWPPLLATSGSSMLVLGLICGAAGSALGLAARGATEEGKRARPAAT